MTAGGGSVQIWILVTAGHDGGKGGGGARFFPTGIPPKLGTFPKEFFDLWVNFGHGRSRGGVGTNFSDFRGHVVFGRSLIDLELFLS